jgi:hypothetical protein
MRSSDYFLSHRTLHHTVTSFIELARTVGMNWKSAGKDTKDYCAAVARLIKERHTELIIEAMRIRLKIQSMTSRLLQQKVRRIPTLTTPHAFSPSLHSLPSLPISSPTSADRNDTIEVEYPPVVIKGNVSRREMISNVMATTGLAVSHQRLILLKRNH